MRHFVNMYTFKTLCLIPARYDSSRLPGKPLLQINGISIINRVCQQVNQCRQVNTVIVLTDDPRIQREVQATGVRCELVTEPCLNGTERIVKWFRQTGATAELIVNVQGDEPYINPEHIDQCIENYHRKNGPEVRCSTLHFLMEPEADKMDRSTGKLVLDRFNNILYCSRNPIPGGKNWVVHPEARYYGHIGVFVFDPVYLLNEYLVGNTVYQLCEDIEWLKILEDGYRINSVLVTAPEISVDTPEDYAFLKAKYERVCQVEQDYRRLFLPNFKIV